MNVNCYQICKVKNTPTGFYNTSNDTTEVGRGLNFYYIFMME